MKKLFTILLALLLTAALSSALAEEEPTVHTSGDYEYVLLEDGAAEITNCTGNAEYLAIPAELDGYRVTVIGEDAFASNISLTSVSIPDSVTSIGAGAFFSCSSLTSVSIPNSVTLIGEDVFCRCTALTAIALSPDHPTLATIDGVLFDKNNKTLLWYPAAYTAKSYAIPQGIQTIGKHAFHSCRSLTSVSIPDSVTSIGDSAFSYCTALSSVSIPDSVVSIGASAFYSCSSLTSVSIPGSVTSIGDSAFSYCTALTSVSIPDSITSIGASVFNQCISLTAIFLSPDHPTLATFDGALYDMHSKTLILYPAACSAKNYAIPQGIQSIGDNAFYSCRTLTSVSIPDSVASIGHFAFFGCESLTSVSIPDSVIFIGLGAFPSHRILTNVTVVRGSYAEEWALSHNYTCTYMPPTGLPYSDILYRVQADGTVIIVYCETEASRIDIPAVIDGMPVTAIRACAFAGCATLAGVSIPASVVSIGDGAFDGCPNVTFTVERDSYAARWCQSNNLRYIHPDAYDWLLN